MVGPRRASLVLLLVVMLPVTVLAAVRSGRQETDAPRDEPARMLAADSPYHITYPERVHYDGTHLTHDVRQTYDLGGDPTEVATRGRRRRRRGLPRRARAAHYRLQLTPEDEVVLDVLPNDGLLAPGLVIERRAAAGRLGRMQRLRRHCLMRGRLRGRPDSMVAISSCQGLTGYIHADGLQYIVEPVRAGRDVPSGGPRPHLVYRRHAPGAGAERQGSPACRTEGSQASRRHWSASELAWSRSRRAESRARRRRSVSASERAWSRSRRAESRARRRRSVSAERNVETLIVADPDVVQFYADDNLEAYLLTVMNGVAQLYHDASIGNAINVILVRIMILESPEDTQQYFNISGDGDSALKGFCNWQSAMNPSNESHPNHHDVAVLLTRRNICSGNQTCNTLGLAEVSGMCQPSRSCNINQDTGLSVSYTIAHELGHNFGMNHDGPGNGCGQQNGLRKHVMSPNLVNDVTPVVWSRCSRREITKFLDRDWGHCLDDQPTDPEYSYPQEPPGMLYDADHQCKLLYGPAASHCQMGNICETLWCSVEGRCVTKLEPAAEGTSCTGPDAPPDTDTWCSAGQCVEMQSRPRAVDGGWGSWGDWGACSRSCGTGVQSSTRHCDRPVPANGGKYCVGERRRYRTCSTEPCPEEGASFRAQQCSAFDSVPYQGHNYTWTPVYVQTLPCQLVCQPVGHHFTAVLSDAVVDGTPCQLDTDICINGKCRDIGCDGVLGSEARADRCGVCHGNGSLCHTVRDTFTVDRPANGYVVVATLPTGARSIRMEELEGTGPGSFLSVSAVGTGNGTEGGTNGGTDIDSGIGADSEAGTKNSAAELNGDRLIQWSGEYWVGGSVLYYSREDNNESLIIPGPLKSSVVLKVLLQDSVTRVRYEYTVPGHEGAEASQVFSWRHLAWRQCSVPCGGGTQTSPAVCMEDEAGRVEDIYCTAQRPETRARPCNQHDCPPRWYAGPWQACQAECGRAGNHSRAVHCVRSSGKEQLTALAADQCEPSERPEEREACRRAAEDCAWHTGPWKKCSSTDYCGRRTRQVWCPVKSRCKGEQRPATSRPCNMKSCRRRGRNSSKRRRPNSAVRDAAPPLLLERGGDSAAGALTTYRGSRADRALARLKSVLPLTAADRRANYSWSLGPWGECSSLCGEGQKSRTVRCVHLSRRANVELSRCSLPIPDMYAVCTQPCLEWRVDAWSPCSVPCGAGRVTRQVSCPEASRCDLSRRPEDWKPCWEGPCAQWKLGSWRPCSGLCGSGVSHRTAVCTSLRTGLPTEGCGPRPLTKRACGLEPCPGPDPDDGL